MNGVAHGERDISAQSFPLSGMDRAASRTTPDTIFFGLARVVFRSPAWRAAEKNRARHRRWRGRFAVLDPARSIPGAPSCLSREGGNHVTRTAYRRTARRASGHPRSERASADQGRTGSRREGTGAALAGNGGLTGEGGSGAAGAALPLSRWSRSAVFGDLRAVGADRTRSARLKVDLASEINILSAHSYLTRQVNGHTRQVHAKFLIVLMRPRDSLICSIALEQPRQSPTDLQGDEARP